jgi:hypothetical protein
MRRMLTWLLKEAWEKINILNTWRDIQSLGKKYGKRFFWAAIIWEAIEDIVFPYLSWRLGVPELIPVFLILHFEPIVYPVFFWAFRTWDRLQGKELWDPDRSAHSHHWRSAVKVLVYQLAVNGWLAQFIGWKALAIFAGLSSLFGFVHERIWNDANWGINQDDSVLFRRIVVKTGTHLLMTTFVLFPILRVSKAHPLGGTLLLAQLITGIMFLVLESVWSKSLLGIHTVGVSHSPPFAGGSPHTEEQI